MPAVRRLSFLPALLSSASLALVACGGEGGLDGGPMTGLDGAVDAAVDSGTGPSPDAGEVDGGEGPADAASRDAAPEDGGSEDGSVPAEDAGTADAGERSLRFTPAEIDRAVRHGQGMEVVDLDGNGRPDLLVALSLTDAVHLYLNTGEGPTWQARSISGPGAIVAMHATAVDLDGDGDLDIAAVGLFERSGGFTSPGEVTWYENPGSAGESWTPRTIASGLWGPRHVSAGDLTGDGLADLVVGTMALNDPNGTPRGDGLRWIRNGQGGAGWSEVMAIDASLSEVRSTLVFDVTGNGVLDVVAAGRASDQVVWYENRRSPGQPSTLPTMTRRPIAQVDAPGSIVAAQLDADAALELAVASDAGPLWLDPPADPREPWTVVEVDPSFPCGDGRVYAADFDGDGRTDLAVATGPFGSGELRIYFQEAGGAWSPFTAVGGWGGLNGLVAADFDGDGRIDLATSTYEHGEQDPITLWRNSP